VLWPALLRLNTRYPDIKVEVSIEPALTDIVTAQYDAGVRRGGTDRPGYDRPAHQP
jgi:DNA-binding transcriptional LysR family regulator